MYIYEIKNTINGKRYIGQSQPTNNIRLNNHRYALRCGTHSNSHLQSAWNKYGEKVFVWNKVVVVDTIEELDRIETALIEKYKTLNRKYGYNARPGGSQYKYHTDATKRKIGQANKGNTHTDKLKLRYAKERRIYDYPKYVIDPIGNMHEVVNIKGLCKRYGINDSNFRKMLRGKYKFSEGWRLK